jgi:hypothetical protein
MNVLYLIPQNFTPPSYYIQAKVEVLKALTVKKNDTVHFLVQIYKASEEPAAYSFRELGTKQE